MPAFVGENDFLRGLEALDGIAPRVDGRLHLVELAVDHRVDLLDLGQLVGIVGDEGLELLEQLIHLALAVV